MYTREAEKKDRGTHTNAFKHTHPYMHMHTSVSYKDFRKPWFHVTPQSGKLRKYVFVSFSFPAPACGLPAFGVT
jgi:hypothetical protein